jgi:hypothetical protein
VEATPSSRGFQWFNRKPLGSLVDPQSQDRRTEDGVAAIQTGLTDEEHRSNRCATTQSGDFEAEDMRRDRKGCVEAKQGAVAEHLSDGENLKTSKIALEGHVYLIS